MSGRPSGTVTFLFSDVEGSTSRWEMDPGAMARELEQHDRVLRSAIEGRRGVVFSTAGDSFAAAFESPTDAIGAAIEAQTALAAGLPVRMAIHLGNAEERNGDYYGPVLNRCGRLRDAAHGRQVICSRVVADLTFNQLPTGVELLDLGEHRLKDLQQAEQIFQVVYPGSPSGFPSLATLESEKTNLPLEVTSFVGRSDELAALDERIRGSRLLTLVGPGGCGKSRLALEVAAALGDEFADGVWLVEFASVTDPELVAQSVASIFHVREQGGRALADTLVGYLSRREVLLVLDNCEHLAEAVADLVSALLQRAEGVQILATSQVPLHVNGEAIHPVSPLAVPIASDDLSTLARCDSVQLFVERAAAIRPDFQLTAEVAPLVGSVCRRLDGIPLAIELAAATLRILSVAQIEQRLDDRFRILRHGSQDRPAHHRTLEAAIDWSYGQIGPLQRVLFERLAVFHGGWTLEAAEAVCADDTLRAADVLAALGDLVDRSLVVVTDDGAETRYRYLESVLAYARSRQENFAQSQRAHADWFLRRAGDLDPLLTTDRVESAVDMFSADLGNFRAALDFFESTTRVGSYCSLLTRLGQFFTIRRLQDAKDRYRRALAVPLGDIEPEVAGPLYVRAAFDMWNRAFDDSIEPERRKEAAVDLLHTAVELLIEAGDDLYLAEALGYLTVVDDRSLGVAALEAATRTGSPSAVAFSHYTVGLAAFVAGDHDEAMSHLDVAVAIGDGYRQTFVVAAKAYLMDQLGDPAGALLLSEEAVAQARRIHDPIAEENALNIRSQALLNLGRADEALEVVDKQLALQLEFFGSEDAATHMLAAHVSTQTDNVARAFRHLNRMRESSHAQNTLGSEDMPIHAHLAIIRLLASAGALLEASMAIGAVNQYYETVRISIPLLKAQIDQVTREICEELDRASFVAAFEQGRSATLDELVDLVIARFNDGQTSD